ncbi:MAG: dienelactone hydrolase family protein [Hyphomicrobiaceae bacterium]|nr:dienelactone hydrolase family protein [Hyphomicrobiaceae bacterium]
MRCRCLALLLACFLAIGLAGRAAASEEPWTLTRDIELASRWPQGVTGFGADRVGAVLYRPRFEGRLPAAVIINSSGGVTAHTEHHYARTLARHGMASLVIDSFTARGVRRTGDDQNRVAQSKSNADAFAGYRWLATQDWVDTKRVVVLGMSRGGEAAYSAALDVLRKRMQAGDITFAAHVAISPGSCNFPQRDARTTGGPIFFMLAELDQTQLVRSCMEYIERMRKAGKAEVRLAVYPGVYHAFEATGGIGLAANDWASHDCAGRFERDENFTLYERGAAKRATKGSQTKHLFDACLKRGYVLGGDDRVKAQATADLVQFLRDAGVLEDAAARTVVPDCGKLPEGVLRLTCARARNGWTGDLVALARAHLRGSGVARDDLLAARLLELAAARRNPQAQWELSILLRNGTGIPRDPARALELAIASAQAGDPADMNVLGVMIRDGIGRPRDDSEARIWFERSADLLNTHAMANLGRFHRDGRGGLAKSPAAAVALWSRAVIRDDHPWAQLHLAEALEKGEGVTANAAEALALYRAAAAQDREPEARKRATEAVARLDLPVAAKQ